MKNPLMMVFPPIPLTDPAARLMAEAARMPWSTVPHLADQAGLTYRQAIGQCDKLMLSGLLQITVVADAFVFAPSQEGLQALAHHIGISVGVLLKRTNGDAERFWLLRTAAEVTQVVNVFGARLARSLRAKQLSVHWETMLLRRLKGHELALHGRFDIPELGQRFIVLVDSGLLPIGQWWRHLRYCQVARLPQLLVITTTHARAMQLLIFARQIAPGLRLAATADRAALLTGDPLTAQWQTFPDDTPTPERGLGPALVFPFGLPAMSATPTIKPSPSQQVVDMLQPPKPRESTAPTFDLTTIPKTWPRLREFEQMTVEVRRVFDFVAQHSAAPATAIARFAGMSVEQTTTTLSILQSHSLCECFQPRGRNITPPLWSASAQAMQLWLRSQAYLPDEDYVTRYANARAMHERHAGHTQAVFDFFTRLHHDAERRSRAGRFVDAVEGQVNDGIIPHYEVEAFEDDVSCAANFIYGGARYRWMPDAYGVLRVDLRQVRFWLEIDGSPGGTAHLDPERWERKLSGLCAFVASRNWLLRYRRLPLLLIVTTDLRAVGLIQDVLTQMAVGYSIAPPRVYVASSAAIDQRGPLAAVWQAAHELKPKLVNVFEVRQPLTAG